MDFDLYFAGYFRKEIQDLVISNNFNQLLSNANDRKQILKYIEAKKNGWKGKLLIDSGAFSVHRSGKKVNLDDYIKFLNENHEYFDLYIQLDDIPGEWNKPKTKEQLESSPIKTWENYLYMRSKLVNPNKLLPVFHQGEHFDYLKQMLEFKDEKGNHIPYICISSNKNFDATKRFEWYKRCFAIIEKSSNPNVKVHSLGTQSESHCEFFPFTSVDATTWIMSAVTGSIYTKYGPVILSDRQLDRKEHIKNNLSYDLWEEYIKSNGFTTEQLIESSLERVRWNCLYLGNWAISGREYKGPKSFKKRSLF